ncbi:Gfo/Idh/MocA family protein [[Clostridium] aminophilum]|uniref:Predicted dehydrogenase n=1 Tax=[Clostridium] aminophilum TaxID=1526 RepID=A0A1I6J641_9FIRM|nr:Gfo/Idh/MocA family oxidoreductase [[Clostridium] aminophilum]SFR74401.1 Predicted dehydrogenase [[Clostridium] aminophilum]
MTNQAKTVVIGTVGAGYAARLHGNGYKKINSVPFRLKAICDIDQKLAKSVKDEFGYETMTSNYDEMLADPEIDVIDIVTPPYLHVPMAIKAILAGKHVICEKPLTGYFGKPGEKNVGLTTLKATMYKACMKQMEELRKVLENSDRKFLYAENFVYATPVQKAAEIIRAKKSKILFMKGEESLKGSSSPVAGKWNKTGGGILVRTGSHPLCGMLWLKQQEAKARGEAIGIKSVSADVGVTSACLNEYEHRHIAARPEDVEDYAAVTVTFTDGTKCLTIASDTVLGGSKNYIEVYANDNALMCNITPTDILNTYFLDEDGLDDVYISEMLPQKLGWNKAFVSDEVIRGYTGELTDFVETIAYDREPTSGFDLAFLTTQIMYAAYMSAEEGRRVDF